METIGSHRILQTKTENPCLSVAVFERRSQTRTFGPQPPPSNKTETRASTKRYLLYCPPSVNMFSGASIHLHIYTHKHVSLYIYIYTHTHTHLHVYTLFIALNTTPIIDRYRVGGSAQRNPRKASRRRPAPWRAPMFGGLPTRAQNLGR